MLNKEGHFYINKHKIQKKNWVVDLSHTVKKLKGYIAVQYIAFNYWGSTLEPLTEFSMNFSKTFLKLFMPVAISTSCSSKFHNLYIEWKKSFVPSYHFIKCLRFFPSESNALQCSLSEMEVELTYCRYTLDTQYNFIYFFNFKILVAPLGVCLKLCFYNVCKSPWGSQWLWKGRLRNVLNKYFKHFRMHLGAQLFWCPLDCLWEPL